jgi:hypothetical protein
MLIEVKETHPPGAGKRVATVIAADGDRFDIWPEQLGNFRVGCRYEVETEDREWRGRTFRKITKATPVSGAASPQQQSSGQVARSYFDEAAYAGHVVAALILKGDVVWNPQNPRQMAEATRVVRNVWRATSDN